MSRPIEDSAPTRHSLLLRLKKSDDSVAWGEFFEAYWELIYNVARKAGLNDPEAQEVVQETVLAVSRKIGDFKADRQRGSFKSWLLGQARWRIGDQFRARKRSARAFGDAAIPVVESTILAAKGDAESEPDGIVGTAADPFSEIWSEEWEQHILRTALERVKAQVSVKQFQLFDLHALQGLTVSASAKAAGTTVAAVYMAKSRVGRVLRREVKALKVT